LVTHARTNAEDGSCATNIDSAAEAVRIPTQPGEGQIADGVKETSFFVGEEAAGVEGGAGN